ncbi:MAG TPA: response regulator transcription factor [Burkholderiales bacterium]|jgi:DNA-binding NarL/FixJ family response regulator|nr:response regulator transcription factor [Burkholderiales bacterium]
MHITVFIADDHPLIRDGLRSLLAAHANIRIVGTAGNGREAVREVQRLRPDVVLMDITMPELNGIEATRQLAERCPSVKVIILSVHATVEHYYQAARAGARGYLLKESAAEEVAAAIRAAHVGKRFVSARIAECLQTKLDAGSPIDSLSRREREILQLVAEGHPSAEIATLISISPKSVDTYRCRLMQKLGLRGLCDMVKFAIRHGLTSTE